MKFKSNEGDDIEHINEFLHYLNSINFDIDNNEEHNKLFLFLKIKDWFSKNEYEFIQSCEQNIFYEIIISKIDELSNFFGGRAFVQNGSHLIQQINFEEIEKEKDFFEEVYLQLYSFKIKYQKSYEFNENISLDEILEDICYLYDSYKKGFEIEQKVSKILVEKCVTNKEDEEKQISSSMYH